MSRLLIIASVDAEADAVCAGLMGTWRPAPPKRLATSAPTSTPPAPARARPIPARDRQLLTAVRFGPYLARRSGDVTVLAAGVGGPAAAAGTAACLALAAGAGDGFDLVVTIGVAGGFPGQADLGDVVVADRIVAADLGAQSPPAFEAIDDGDGPPPEVGFLDLAELGLGPAALAPHPGIVTQLAQTMDAVGRPVRVGAIASVSTVTGTDARAGELAARYDPLAEAMEGYGAAVAASAFGVPFAEVRAICNPVGRRDRARWDLPGAMSALSAVSVLLAEFADTVDLTGVRPAAPAVATQRRDGPARGGPAAR
jgi:futalosine hydrolase